MRSLSAQPNSVWHVCSESVVCEPLPSEPAGVRPRVEVLALTHREPSPVLQDALLDARKFSNVSSFCVRFTGLADPGKTSCPDPILRIAAAPYVAAQNLLSTTGSPASTTSFRDLVTRLPPVVFESVHLLLLRLLSGLPPIESTERPFSSLQMLPSMKVGRLSQ